MSARLLSVYCVTLKMQEMAVVLTVTVHQSPQRNIRVDVDLRKTADSVKLQTVVHHKDSRHRTPLEPPKLTQCRRVLPEQLTGAQLVKKLPSF
jgi:hypothetical protein